MNKPEQNILYKPVWCEEGDDGLWVCEHENETYPHYNET